MAPAYRNNPQTRRGARAGYPEHDDFEGLPTRQWRKEWVNIAPPPEVEETKKKDRWAEELPHGMPKGSEQLPAHSYALLRAARSGRMHKRPVPAEDEDGDVDGLPSDKTEKKAAPVDEGFKVLIWKQVPRNEEGPTISHLAKRHKNTITLPSKALATQLAGPTITKAQVRRLDAAGNPYTQEVTITDGQPVEGEIISTSVISAPELAGQVPPAAATPTRRKPPIPQKKKPRGRGRGRGRGRMVPLQASTRPDPQGGAALDGTSQVKNESIGPDGVKIENEDGKAGQDVDMRDSSAVEDDDGEEGEGDDGDEDDGEESGTPAENEDQEMEDAPALPTSSSVADAAITSTTSTAGGVPEAVSNFAPPGPNSLNTDPSRIEGSPLKNVLLRSPTETTPQIPPMVTSTGTSLSEVPGGPDTGLQPSPMESQPQPQQASTPEVVEETPVEDTKPTEAPAPEEAAPETAAESTETVPEVMLDAQAVTLTEEPREPSAPPVEQPPVEEVSEAPLAVQDIPLATSEDPKTGEAPEAEVAAPEPEEPLPESGPAEEIAAPAAAPVPAPVEPAPAAALAPIAPAAQAMTEDGTDDGSDILGALGAQLDAQAEEDVPRPSSAPAVVPPAEQPTEPPTGGEGESAAPGNAGED